MKRIFSLSVILLFVLSVSFGQKNILITIGDKKFTIEEFERIYKKNNTQLNDEIFIRYAKLNYNFVLFFATNI